MKGAEYTIPVGSREKEKEQEQEQEQEQEVRKRWF
jgi:hypothetical protein